MSEKLNTEPGFDDKSAESILAQGESFEEHMGHMNDVKKNENVSTKNAETGKETTLKSIKDELSDIFEREDEKKTTIHEKENNPDSNEMTRQPEAKAGSYAEEAVKRGKSCEHAIGLFLSGKKHIIEQGYRDDKDNKGKQNLISHVEHLEAAFNNLIDGKSGYRTPIELGEGCRGKIETIERVISGSKEFDSFLNSVNMPIRDVSETYKSEVEQNLDVVMHAIKVDKSYAGECFDVSIDGKKGSYSLEDGAKMIANGMIQNKSPELVRKSSEEKLAKSRSEHTSDESKILEAFAMACSRGEITPSKNEEKILDQITELKEICDAHYDSVEAKYACENLSVDLKTITSESSIDFTKARKQLEKIAKKQAKQAKKLQKKMNKVDFSAMQRKLESIQ